MRDCARKPAPTTPSRAARVPGWPRRRCATGSRTTAVAGSVHFLPKLPPLPPAPRLGRRAALRHKAGAKAETSNQDRRRFAFAHAGQLWMSDVMHGPSAAIPGRGRRKSYLIAFLDDATRVVPYCAFALSEDTQAFLPVFKQALKIGRASC